MRRAWERVSTALASDTAALLALLAVCLLAYMPGIHQMGFYWDDWVMNWIAQNMGNAGLAQYFSTNRPVWGLLFQLTTPVLGSSALAWQMAAIFARFFTGLALWSLVRLSWPAARTGALAAAVLFVIYPSFQQQHVALLYTHFYLVLIFLLGSLACTLAALRARRFFWPFTLLGLVLGLANLLMMEYFFLLDLLRPVLIWVVLSETQPNWKARLRRTLGVWLPYLAAFLGAAFWRAFLFPYTQENYHISFLDQLRQSPLAAVGDLIGRLGAQLETISSTAWRAVFHFAEDAEVTGLPGGLTGYWIVLGLVALALVLVLAAKRTPAEKPTPGTGTARALWRRLLAAWQVQALLVGLAGLGLASAPFLLTSVPFDLNFPNDRFTLPYTIGAALVLGGLAGGLARLPWGRLLAALAVGGLAALAVGLQLRVGATYIQDWSRQQMFFQQMAWRMPGLKPDTALLVNELRLHPTDNSLSGPLNWIYAPGNPQQYIPYMIIYPTNRLGKGLLPSYEPNTALGTDFLVGKFQSSTSQAVSFLYDREGGCLRLLDPELDPASLRGDHKLVESRIAVLSDPGRVLATGLAHGDWLIAGILPAGNPTSWCAIYEKADLARSQGNWQEVVRLGDAYVTGGTANLYVAEFFPFIEGYAHAGNWDWSLKLSSIVLHDGPELTLRLCTLWQRIDREAGGEGKSAAVAQALSMAKCSLTP